MDMVRADCSSTCCFYDFYWGVVGCLTCYLENFNRRETCSQKYENSGNLKWVFCCHPLDQSLDWCLWRLPYVVGQKRGWGIYPLVFAVPPLFVSIPLFIAELVWVEQAKKHCGHFYTAVCTKFVLEFCRLAQCNDRLAGVQLVLCGSRLGASLYSHGSCRRFCR